jgi:hypothetical protein
MISCKVASRFEKAKGKIDTHAIPKIYSITALEEHMRATGPGASEFGSYRIGGFTAGFDRS